MPDAGLRVFLAWCTRAPWPYGLCEDLRRQIAEVTTHTFCARCGRIVGDRRRLRACFVRNESLCFGCHHRARWPTHG